MTFVHACVIQATTEMARAETIENVGETGGGANGPLSRHNTCRMELPRPFPNWPGLLTTTTITTGSGAGTGAMHLHHNHHHLHPFQAIYMSYPLPYPQSESHDEAQTHQQLPALSPSSTPPPSPLCNQREERDGSFSGEQSGKIIETKTTFCFDRQRKGKNVTLRSVSEHISNHPTCQNDQQQCQH